MDHTQWGQPQRVEGRGVDFLHPLWSQASWDGEGGEGSLSPRPRGWVLGLHQGQLSPQVRVPWELGPTRHRAASSPCRREPTSKSLTTLGKVISALAEMVSGAPGGAARGMGWGGGRWEWPLCPGPVRAVGLGPA